MVNIQGLLFAAAAEASDYSNDYNGEDAGPHIVYGIVAPLILSCITLIGIGGNALVIYIIIANNDMRSVTNFYIANLAVDDIAFLVTCAATTAVSITTEDWKLGHFLCKFIGYMQFVTIQATCCFLTAMTIDRYHLIVHAVNARNTRTIRRAILISLGIWAVSFMIHIPVAINTNVIHDENSTTCYRDFGNSDRDKIFTIFSFMSMYAIPLLIISICYVKILMQVWKRTSMGTESAQAQLRASQRKRKITKMVLIVVILFALSWLPLHCIILGLSFFPTASVWDTHTFQYVYITFLCLAYANSSMNPFVYAFTTTSFKKHFDNIFRGVCFSRTTREKESPVMITETRFSKLAMSTDGNSCLN
ncbi:G-protein coupled receptor 54-like [Antedon mediterranea]|uniref:G-protein coupled receptor 54-like n=1 Tax=Antedon mediterranea TaxID=105859 RepID=UPI003AF45AAE